LGVTIDKEMQQHDWGRRPIDPTALKYLVGDVAHLEALDDVLWGEGTARGIEQEVLEETSYRLACAAQAAKSPDARPADLRLKGGDRTSGVERAVLRCVAALREKIAAALDVPPHRALPNEVLFVIARHRPRTPAELLRIRGVNPARVDPA